MFLAHFLSIGKNAARSHVHPEWSAKKIYCSKFQIKIQKIVLILPKKMSKYDVTLLEMPYCLTFPRTMTFSMFYAYYRFFFINKYKL